MQPLLRLTAIVLLALASISCECAEAQSLTVIRRIDASHGIVKLDKALMRTTDNGKTWVDVTPQLARSETVTAAYYLDENTGWSVVAASTQSGEHTSLRVVSTGISGGFQDGRSVPVPVTVEFMQRWSGTAWVTFADAKHGWLELQQVSSSNFKAGILFATRDGGRSWTELPTPPIVDNIGFISSEVGWIAGGPGENKLYRTADGGQTWTDDRAPQPASAAETQTYYSVPQMDAAGRLFLAATFIKSTRTADTATLAIYTSNDAGASWVSWSVHGGIPTSSRIPTDFSGTALVSVFNDGKDVAQSREAVGNDAKPFIKVHSPAKGTISHAYFVDSSNGWLVVGEDTCDPNGSCKSQTQLLSTSDGGESTLDITPESALRARTSLETAQPDTVIPLLTAYPGFDLCQAPSPTIMQQWKATSPYKAVGIYIGGANRSCKQQTNLNWNWIFDRTCEGWNFLPLWVGLQAPTVTTCSTCSTMNTTPATAYTQGVNEANSAFTAGELDGWFDGAIIYLNIELYTPTPASTAAVQQFVKGWVTTLHQDGFQAGLYVNATNGNDMVTSPPADAVWVAKYTTPANTGVFGLTPMSDSIWTTNQRIHQYDGNVPKIYGGATLSVDEDTVDAASTSLNPALTYFCGKGITPAPPVTCTPGTKLTFSQSQNVWSCTGGAPPCPQYCGSVCITQATCSCPNESPTCEQNSGGYFWNCNNSCTPVVLDAFQEGFHLTSIDNGVPFRVKPAGPLLQMSWTDSNYRNGWLVLDRNHNGLIDDFSELFGNLTAQPASGTPNGYAALAVFDEPGQGGNGNGTIDAGDAIYDQLGVWIDANHNGVSEATELHGLRELGIDKIDLTYHLSRYTDSNGNVFRYRDGVVFDPDHLRERGSYDVLLGIRAEIN